MESTEPASWNARLKHLLGRTRRLTIEFQALITFGVAALGFLGFAAVAENLMERETHAFDKAILLWMRAPENLSDPVGPTCFESDVADITALGGYAIITLIVNASMIYLFCHGTLAKCLNRPLRSDLGHAAEHVPQTGI